MGEVKSLKQKPSGDWFEAVILSRAESVGVNEINRNLFNKTFDAFMSRSYKKAYTGFIELAKAGSSVSQYYLGMMCVEGKGVLQDFCLAHMWLNIASSGGHEKARKQLKKLARCMTLEQVAEAQKQAREWVKAQADDEESLG